MNVFFQELKNVLRDRWQFTLLLIVPIILTIYFAVLFGQGGIQHIATIIEDQDQSPISREIAQQFKQSQYFTVINVTDTNVESDQLIKDEVADLLITIPHNMGNNIKQGKSVQIGISVDGSNMAVSSTALRKASEIVMTYNAGTQIQKIEGKGYLPANAEKMVRPINLQMRQLFNPTGNYGDFLIWGLVAAIAHFPLMIFAAVSMHDNREGFKLTVYFSRLFAYFILGVVQLAISFLILINFTSLIYLGDFVHLALISSLFILSIITFGMLISVLIPAKIMATQIGMIIVLPALLLSGYTWPLEQMPIFIQLLGKAEPLTYYIHPLRDLATSGIITPQYWQGVIVLGMMALFFTLVSILINVGRVSKWQQKSITN